MAIHQNEVRLSEEAIDEYLRNLALNDRLIGMQARTPAKQPEALVSAFARPQRHDRSGNSRHESRPPATRACIPALSRHTPPTARPAWVRPSTPIRCQRKAGPLR